MLRQCLPPRGGGALRQCTRRRGHGLVTLAAESGISSSTLHRPAAYAAAAAAAAAAYVYSQYREWEELQIDGEMEQRLPLTAEAQRTRVVRLKGFLSSEEIATMQAVHDQLTAENKLGSAGRTAGNQAAAYRQGVWETSYLSTDGHFARLLPELRAKLVAAMKAADEAEGWGMLSRANKETNLRCVELHRVGTGGSLPFIHHHDAGSLITLDVLCADRSEFTGGEFRTLEPGGEVQPHAFEKGDAIVFVSHKPHHVTPVLSGERHSLVVELWQGGIAGLGRS